MILNSDVKKLLNELPKTIQGKALKMYLDESIKEMDSVKNCESWEEVMGRKYALKVLDDLFAFFREEKIDNHRPNPYT